MKQDSKVVHSGRQPFKHYGMVNTPIYPSSTILFPTIEAYNEAEQGRSCYYPDDNSVAADLSYAITGTPTSYALAEAISSLEGGYKSILVQSGLAALTTTLMALTSSGDHILIPDTAYGPTRRFCNLELKRFGVETTFYDPLIGADIAGMIRENTTMILVESPGSLTFEVQDIPAISAVAKTRNVAVVMDNSWATPLFFKPFMHGVDISIQAITKYIGGHSDVIMGAITTNEHYYRKIYKYFRHSGACVSPYDCYLAQRGIRSLSARLKQHEESALKVASWLETRKEVAQVLYPALPSHPGHALWKRDFTGASGLFSFILKPYAEEAIHNMINNMGLFAIGCSWGGYESLILNFNPTSIRTATNWQTTGPCIRVHIGLENVDDLIDDLEKGLKTL